MRKISPDNSEEPPGLSAGSSDSEELPDPTRGTVSRRRRHRQERRCPEISATCGNPRSRWLRPAAVL